MKRRRRKPKNAALKIALWILKRRFLTACIAVLIVFAFVGKCSKNEYSARTPEEIAYLKSLRAKYAGAGRRVDLRSAERAIAEACAFIAAAENDVPNWDTPDARALLLATAVVESDLRARYQDGGGDAIGLFQVEYGTYRDLWHRAIRYKHPRLFKAMRERFGEPRTDEIRFEDLQKNDIVGAIFARVKYFESGAEIPPADNPDAQAAVYKKYYNTAAGRGDTENFKRKTQKYLRPAAQGGK